MPTINMLQDKDGNVSVLGPLFPDTNTHRIARIEVDAGERLVLWVPEIMDVSEDGGEG